MSSLIFFLSPPPPLSLQRIASLRACSGELAVLRKSVRLSLLLLSCGEVNDLLSQTAEELADLVATHLTDVNREKNKE